jgi:F-box/WD-40 domain protein 7
MRPSLPSPQGNRTCPVTGMRLRHLELTPNYALRAAIQVRTHAQPSPSTGGLIRPVSAGRVALRRNGRLCTESLSRRESPPSRQQPNQRRSCATYCRSASVAVRLPGSATRRSRPRRLCRRRDARLASSPCAPVQGHNEIVWAVEVCGRQLFSASADKTIRVWDIESRRCEKVMEDHTVRCSSRWTGVVSLDVFVGSVVLASLAQEHPVLRASATGRVGSLCTCVRQTSG